MGHMRGMFSMFEMVLGLVVHNFGPYAIGRCLYMRAGRNRYNLKQNNAPIIAKW